jgi:hypothetical protein
MDLSYRANIFRDRSWTCPTSPPTTKPCGFHRAAARALANPLAMLISGMPHAEATCPPTESYPTYSLDRAICAAKGANAPSCVRIPESNARSTRERSSALPPLSTSTDEPVSARTRETFGGILANAQTYGDVGGRFDRRQRRDVRFCVLDCEYFARPRSRNIGQALTCMRPAWKKEIVAFVANRNQPELRQTRVGIDHDAVLKPQVR